MIVNSARGGHESDEKFYRETLRLVDIYLAAGSRPTRWFVQTWYTHPKQIVPVDAPYTLSVRNHTKSLWHDVFAFQDRFENPARRVGPGLSPGAAPAKSGEKCHAAVTSEHLRRRPSAGNGQSVAGPREAFCPPGELLTCVSVRIPVARPRKLV